MNQCPKSSTKSGCSFKQALVSQHPVYDQGHKRRRKRKRKGAKYYD